MGQSQALNLRMTVYASLFTALVVIGGYLSFPIPFSPVPIVLSDFFVVLAGLLLGANWGLASMALFIFLGALGLPVFAGGKAGLAVLFGPTGGFLFSFLLSAFVIGLIACRGKPSAAKDLVALIVGYVIIYACGVPWLKFVLHLSWSKALAAGLIPFIPGTVIKMIAAMALVRVLRPRLQQEPANLQVNE